MPIIAPQHQWKDKGHVPSEDWPIDCMVQWGQNGVVFGNSGTYRTAFFEAFPSVGFFRGEGATIKDAEADALRAYKKAIGCESHEWSRKGYTNGGGFCRKCGMFGTPFKPIVKLGSWNKPLSESEISIVLMGGLWETQDPEQDRYQRRILAKLARRGIKLPPLPKSPISILSLDHDDYVRACTDAIMSWIHENGGPDLVFQSSSRSSNIGVFFSTMAQHRISREYSEWVRELGGDVVPKRS